MPGAMTCRVPEGLSVSIQHLSKGMRPKADVGPPDRGPQPQLRAHLAPGKPARTRRRIGRTSSLGQLAEAVAAIVLLHAVASNCKLLQPLQIVGRTHVAMCCTLSR
jgi:hypothetical protein